MCVVDKEDEVDEDNVEVLIKSLHLKMEELTELIKSETMVTSKGVLEEQPAKDCTKLTAKVKALKKIKEEVSGLLIDLLENRKESQYQCDDYETVSDRQSFFGVVHVHLLPHMVSSKVFSKNAVWYLKICQSMARVSTKMLRISFLVLRRF
jgi:hypothetical protein